MFIVILNLVLMFVGILSSVYNHVCSTRLSCRTHAVHVEDVAAPRSSARSERSGSSAFCMKASVQLKCPGGLKHTEQGQRTCSGSRRCHLSQLTCSLDCLRPLAFITATFIQPFITSCSLVKSRNPRREAVWKSAMERARRQSPACFTDFKVSCGIREKGTRGQGHFLHCHRRPFLHWGNETSDHGEKKRIWIASECDDIFMTLIFF